MAITQPAAHGTSDIGALSLGLVAGEASGDLLAAALLRGLGERFSQFECFGVGGPAMRAEGMQTWSDISQLSVRGYAEVLKALPRLLWLRASIRRRMTVRRPTAFLGVDAPDFNLSLERRLRASGLLTIHFISPSIWAWRPERIDAIRAAVDHMLLVFPFEQPIYDAAGIPATYVGHPLADLLSPVDDPAPSRTSLGFSATDPLVALLPGSRPDEISYMARRFIETAAWLHARRRDIRFVLPAANEAIFSTLQNFLRQRVGSHLPIRLVEGQAHTAMSAADVVLVASGTATLEAALLGKPMTVCYRMSPVSYRMMRGKGLLPWIALPNILCQDSLVPEFIQDNATAEAMGTMLLKQLDDLSGRARLRERFDELHAALKHDCAARGAEVVASLCAASVSR